MQAFDPAPAPSPEVPTFNGNTMTVNLTGVTDVQRITVTLNNVTDSFAQVLPDTPVSVNMPIFDTTANKTVNASDVGETKASQACPSPSPTSGRIPM